MKCKFCGAETAADAKDGICPSCREKVDSATLTATSFKEKSLPGDGLASLHQEDELPDKPRGRQLWCTAAEEDDGCAWPIAVALRPPDELLVLDAPEDYRILRFDRAGKLLGTLVEIPAEDEEGGVEDPQDLCVDRSGNIYVPDAGNDRISVWNPDGEFSHWVGCEGTLPGQFLHPLAVDVDSDGFLYVADTFNHRIQRVSADGLVDLNLSEVDRWGGLKHLISIAVDAEGNIYVVDAELNAVLKLSPSGKLLQSLPATEGDRSPFQGLCDVRIDRDGTWCISDARNMRVRRFDAEGKMLGIIDFRQEEASAAGEGGDIALLDGSVVIPDRSNDRVICVEFELLTEKAS